MPGFGQRPLALAGKELKIFFRDPQMLFFSLAMPLVLIMFMVATFGSPQDFHATAHLVNLDRGLWGAELVERLKEVPGMTVNLLDANTAERKLEEAALVNVVFIGEDFSEKLSAGESPGGAAAGTGDERTDCQCVRGEHRRRQPVKNRRPSGW